MEGGCGCYAGTIFKLGLKIGGGVCETETCRMLLWCNRETKSSEVAKGRMVSGNPGHEPLIWCVVASSTAISSIY